MLKIDDSAHLWNKNTKFAVLGSLIAVVIGAIAVKALTDKGQRLHVIILSIAIFSSSLFIQWQGINKSWHFYREDAQLIYIKLSKLFADLRVLATKLRKEYDNWPDFRSRIVRDKGYQEILKEIKREVSKCYDMKLEKQLGELVKLQLLMAKFQIPQIAQSSDIRGQAIENYIKTKLRSRPINS